MGITDVILMLTENNVNISFKLKNKQIKLLLGKKSAVHETHSKKC